jgi:hypothetical protein
LGVNGNSKPECKQIFENVIPNIARHKITDKNLVQSLFGNKIHPAYVTHSDTSETIIMMQAKLCSNNSNEWILFTILEKGDIIRYFHYTYIVKSLFIETIEKSIDHNAYVMESLSDEYTKGHQCVSFDFMKCSLSKLGISYPKLFQFTHEQHMYVSIILYCICCGTRH